MLIRKTQLKRPASAAAAGVACAIALSLANGPAFAESESQTDNPAVDWQPTTAFAGCVELRAEISDEPGVLQEAQQTMRGLSYAIDKT